MERSRPANSNGGSPAVEPERIELRQVASPSPNPDPVTITERATASGNDQAQSESGSAEQITPAIPSGSPSPQAGGLAESETVRASAVQELPTDEIKVCACDACETIFGTVTLASFLPQRPILEGC